MSIPSKTAFRKAAKGAVMAGTFAVSALAVGALVKRRLYPASPVAEGAAGPPGSGDTEGRRTTGLSGSGDAKRLGTTAPADAKRRDNTGAAAADAKGPRITGSSDTDVEGRNTTAAIDAAAAPSASSNAPAALDRSPREATE